MLKQTSAVQKLIRPAILVAWAFLAAQPARGAGYIRLDSSGFLRSASDRGDMISSLILGPEFSSRGKWVDTSFDLKGIAFLSDRSSFTIEAANAYVSTSRQLMPHHQLTLGRRIYDWSVMEDEWSLGLWSARFLWNPLKPERIGLTGAFYTYESAKWRLMAFATPLSPPERSYPIRVQSGKLSSPSPDYVPPYDSLMLNGNVVPIHYTITYPPVRELLVRPAAGMSLRYGAKDGPWASLAYGVMPMHQPQIAAEAGFNPVAGRVESVVHPRTLFHHLVTGETGYNGELWRAWVSVSGESPIQRAAPANWIVDPMGPALLTGAGGEMRLERYFALSASYMGVDESKPAREPDAIPLNLPSRFEYSRAFRLEGKWTGVPRFLTDVRWIYDLEGSSSLFSADLVFQPEGKRNVLNTMFGGAGSWTFGVGLDLISSTSRTGFIGQFAGNDRVRGRISYAF